MGQRTVGDDQGQRSEVVDVGLDVRNQVVSCWACLVLTLFAGPPESLQRGTVRCGPICMGHPAQRAVRNRPWKRLAVMTPLSVAGRENGWGWGVHGHASASSKNRMAGNIVRLGRGCSSQSVRDHPQTGGWALPQPASCLQRRSGSHLSQLSIGEADSVSNPNAMILDADDSSGILPRTCDVVMVLCPV